MVNRGDFTSALLVVLLSVWIVDTYPVWLVDTIPRISDALFVLTFILFLLVSWRKDRRWPSESRLDSGRVDLKFNQMWIVLRLQEFIGFFFRLFGKSGLYFRRMVLSKEDGLEVHYIEPLNGLDVVAYFELGQVSAVHYWYETTSTYDADSGQHIKSRSYHFAINAGSVIHYIDKATLGFAVIDKIANRSESLSGGTVPHKIRKLCDILDLKLRKTKPKATKFSEIYEVNIKKTENNNGNLGTVSTNNRIEPEYTDTGPHVPEDWYLTYDGPAPVVEGIYDQNYGVDRGNGAVPVEFYIKKWGVPEGFGETEHEKLWCND